VSILVTGGTGFIGSALAKALLATGKKVTILDNFSSGKNRFKENEPFVKVVNGSIQDKSLVEMLVSESNVVYHLAATVGVRRILSDPIESLSTNIFGSQVVLEAAARYNKRIYLSSSSEVYGKNSNQPLLESHDRVIGTPLNYRWIYSDSKAIEESMASYYFQTSSLPVTILRFFNIVGSLQSSQQGMVLTRFIGAALQGHTLEVYGDGYQTRTFCHVMDCVDAVLQLENYNTSIGEIYNIGGEQEISMFELAHKVIEITNSKSSIRKIPYNQEYGAGFEDMPRRVPDTNKLKSLTGWYPKIKLDDIIRDIAKSLVM
jgi:UDP-glucose 4-epimerase